MVDAFEVPERDRYQVVVVSVTSRARSQAGKLASYENLVRQLHEHAGIEPRDEVVSIVENCYPDWTFGHGRTQFITGEL